MNPLLMEQQGKDFTGVGLIVNDQNYTIISKIETILFYSILNLFELELVFKK